VGGILEKLTRGGVTEYRHRIPAGSSSTAIHVRRSSGSTATYYTTRDHLGSSTVTMDSNGASLVNLSFGAYGKRRGAAWQDVPSSNDWDQITITGRDGFTGHEHLDNVGAIHMNGRVYDPQLGRFMSADPLYVGDLANPQSLNPYGYVRNRPLSFVDPSGFQEESRDVFGEKKGIDGYWEEPLFQSDEYRQMAWDAFARGDWESFLEYDERAWRQRERYFDYSGQGEQLPYIERYDDSEHAAPPWKNPNAPSPIDDSESDVAPDNSAPENPGSESVGSGSGGGSSGGGISTGGGWTSGIGPPIGGGWSGGGWSGGGANGGGVTVVGAPHVTPGPGGGGGGGGGEGSGCTHVCHSVVPEGRSLEPDVETDPAEMVRSSQVSETNEIWMPLLDSIARSRWLNVDPRDE
jgi:RHS repeat-associated protein